MILFLDLETTGLLKPGNDYLNQPGIVQIGAIKIHERDPDEDIDQLLRDFQIGNEFSSFINPEIGTWEEGAIKTHGISKDTVANAPTFFEIFPKLSQFALGCDTWGGYNVAFDKGVLWYQLLRYGFERNFPWPQHDVDVMKLAAARMEVQGKRGNKFPKLTEAYESILGHPMQNAHDALADIRATAELYMELVK